jgi:predicted Zn-dependent protease
MKRASTHLGGGLILAVLAVAGMTAPHLSCGAVRHANILSDQDEMALGEQFSHEVEAEITLWDDPVVEAYIDSLGQVLARHSDRSEIPYQFKVVDTDDVNAFALPGGYLYVNRGLISTAENLSELMGVIGHEVGHVVGKHGARQITKQYGFSILMSLALGADPGMWEQMVAGVLGTGVLLHYGREAELEADAYGTDEMYRSGNDPRGLVTFFEKLLAMHDAEPGPVEKLFSTHPPTRERIEKVLERIESMPPRDDLVTDEPRFHEIQRRLPPLGAGTEEG